MLDHWVVDPERSGQKGGPHVAWRFGVTCRRQWTCSENGPARRETPRPCEDERDCGPQGGESGPRVTGQLFVGDDRRGPGPWSGEIGLTTLILGDFPVDFESEGNLTNCHCGRLWQLQIWRTTILWMLELSHTVPHNNMQSHNIKSKKHTEKLLIKNHEPKSYIVNIHLYNHSFPWLLSNLAVI